MIKEVIATGKNYEQALDLGCQQLGLTRADVDFEIIDMGSKGFLGLGGKPAKVRVFIEVPDPKPAPAPKAAPVVSKKPEEKPVFVEKKKPQPKAEKKAAPEKKEEPEYVEELAAAPAEEKRVYNIGDKDKIAVAYVSDVLKAMGLDQINVSHTVRDNVVNIKLEGDVSGAAIGRRGETLDALQYLAGLAANREEGDYVRIVLDSGNYRDKRRVTLEQLAKKLANSVIKSGRSTTLEPMNPYERRIIHATISEINGVTSSSIGEEPNRRVVISSTSPAPQRSAEDKPAGERKGGRGGRGARNGGRRDDRRGGKGGRGPRREKPAPYQESSKREVPPAEAANQPLYGKIEI